ncbi:MAG: hypothetical protein ACK4VO_13065 [Pseudobdellovibrio sp.]
MEKITLVLGAGASVAYGYPTGFELVGNICNSNIEYLNIPATFHYDPN